MQKRKTGYETVRLGSNLSRRRVLTGLSAGAAVCAWGARLHANTPGAIEQRLQGLAGRAGGNLADPPGVALYVRRGDTVLFEGAAGYAAGLSADEQRRGIPKRPMTAQTKMRVASVSKMAVALTAETVLKETGIGFDADVRTWWPSLRNPAHPGVPITMSQLFAHLSSLRDPEVYWIAAPGRIEDLMTEAAFELETPPGTFFTYCNLTFGVIATILERISGRRFDLLAHDVLQENGIPGGFNWSGVATSERRVGASLYRSRQGMWAVQTDGPDVLNADEPLWLHEDGFALRDYEIGSNGTLFSPQGGLRAGVADIARLAEIVARRPSLATPVWRYRASPPNGEIENDLFEASGHGCFHWTPEKSPIKGHAMIGHDGEAYGLYSGAWWLPHLKAQVGFAITGTPQGDQPPGRSHAGYNIWSQTFFDLAADILQISSR